MKLKLDKITKLSELIFFLKLTFQDSEAINKIF